MYYYTCTCVYYIMSQDYDEMMMKPMMKLYDEIAVKLLQNV